MMGITGISEFFLLSVSFGVGFFSFLANSKETGAGFLKLVTSIGFSCVGLACALYLAQGNSDIYNISLYVLSFTAFLISYLFHKDEKSAFMWILYAVFSSALFALILDVSKYQLTPSLFIFSSVLLLGVITYLMVMGHWYLVTPRLSEKPLAVGIKICWVILFLKIIWSTVNAFQNSHYFSAGTMEAGGYAFNWMMLLMRYLWGYIVIGVMSYYTWRLIIIRSTQSATGVLYAMTFFVFVGELISIYLHFTYGLYI